MVNLDGFESHPDHLILGSQSLGKKGTNEYAIKSEWKWQECKDY